MPNRFQLICKLCLHTRASFLVGLRRPHLAEETNGGALIFRAELAEIEQNRLSYAESDPTKGPLIPEVVPEGRRIGGLGELRRDTSKHSNTSEHLAARKRSRFVEIRDECR